MVAEVTEQQALNRTLPSRYYYDPDILEQEKERIFYDSWVGVGRAEEVAEAGDYVLKQVGEENVIVVRTKSGEIKAFYNVCRHRGNRICLEERGRAGGSAFSCRYHGWTYSLDGELMATPNVEPRPSLEGDPLSLFSVAARVWEGFIFLNLSGTPEPFEPSLGLLEDKLPRYSLANLRVGHRKTYEIKANWKVVQENNMECYHCPGVHPELCRIHPSYTNGVIGQELRDGVPFVEGMTTYSDSGVRKWPVISTLTEEDLGRFRSLTLYPNFFLGLIPDQAFAFYLWPVTSKTSRLTVHWLFEESVVGDPGFDPSESVYFLDRVLTQDYGICEDVQEAMRSRAYERGVYLPHEHLPYKFNQWVLEKLGI